MDIKKKIRDLMDRQGYTAYALSKATGLSQARISNWFNKINNEPSLQALERVCDVFGITMAELFAKEEDVMLPCKDDLKEIYHKWQRLTPLQRNAVKVHIDSYIKIKDKVDLNSNLWYYKDMDKMIKIAICDDDLNSINTIEQMINKANSQLEINCEIFKYCDGYQFEKDCINGTYKADIIFLDIEINNDNGVDIAQRMRDVGDNSIIIFVTSYDCYITKALRTGPFQYLKKPLEYNDFIVDYTRAIEMVRLKNNKISLRINQSTLVVNAEEIYYFEVFRGKTYVYINNEKKTLDKRMPLSKIEKVVDEKMFVHINQSILVNINKIIKITTDNVIFDNDIKCSISRNYKNSFLQRYNSYLSGIKLWVLSMVY